MRYVLDRGNWRAVVDTLGAELVSCREKDLEYVWTGDPAYWTGRQPILFPIVCSLRNDRTSFGGVPYAMKRHGFARKMEFSPVSVAEDRISLVLTDSGETLKQYPYPFVLTVTHELTDSGYRTTYEVMNRNSSVISFAIGGHPGFSCPLRIGEDFSDYRVIFAEPEDPKAYLLDADGLLSEDFMKEVLTEGGTVLPLSHRLFEESALIFQHVKSRRLSLVNGKTGAGIDFSFGNFCDLGIWTPPGKNAPFICLEPWQGLPSYRNDAWIFEEKADVVFLPGGQTYTAFYEMKRRGK